MPSHSERDFENAIEAELTSSGGYEARSHSAYDETLAQIVTVIVEHFRRFVLHELGGRAKAMVVTGSRLAAVRYKRAFDRYIQDQGYSGIRSLVAFSGTVEDPDDPGSSYTEVAMNDGLAERELPETFERDDYRVLLVAEKYQTGFDQPLLQTMLDSVVQRFQDREDEDREQFRGQLTAYRNLYAFLSQIIPYQDSDLERLHAFVRNLLAKLPARGDGQAFVLDDEVALRFFRLQQMTEGSIDLGEVMTDDAFRSAASEHLAREIFESVREL